MGSFLKPNGHFVNYTTEHYISVFIFILIGIGFIIIGQKILKGDTKRKFITSILFLMFAFQVSKVFIYQYLGIFNIQTDLPLHLCNMMPLFLGLAYYFNSRLWWSISFTWIMAGTFQSLITPTLTESFPHYEWWRYWIIHCWLVTGAFYGILVFGFRIRFRDVFFSLFWLNVLSFTVYFIDRQIGANYMYMVSKPDGKTMYDLLSAWPTYILQLEFIALAFFFVFYLPFYIIAKRQKIE